MQKIPLVDLKAQYLSIKEEIDTVVSETMSQTAFIMGQRVDDLENAFAAYSGTQYGVGVSSATCGLHLVLHALGVKPGDEVIIPSMTFIATAEAVCHCGATPVFADIDMNTYTMEPAALESLITPRTRVIMPVHLYGRCADMNAINAIAEKHNLKVVEDAAQAHGASDQNGNRAGSMAAAGVFSFYPGKNLGAFGDGGMITTKDEALYGKMRMLANHGRTSKYLHEMIGYNYRLDAIQASIVNVKLRHLDNWNAARLRLARRYNSALEGSNCMRPAAPDGHVFHLYVLRVAEREALMAQLKDAGIASGIHYPVPCHQQPCFKTEKTVSLPVTETMAPQIVTLPLYPEMSNDQQDRVISIVREHCHHFPLL